MADDKTTKIGITTTGDTSGAEKVEKSIFKIEDAGKQAQRELDVEAAKQRQALDELDDSTQQVGESAKETDEQLKRMINIERAQVASQVAKSVAQIGSAVKNLANDIRGTDSELAETLDNSAVALDSVTGALSGAAQGFAVGGPFGAAVGGLIGLMSGPLKSAYDGMVTDLNNAAKAENAAAIATAKLKQARADFVKEVRDNNIRAIFDSETTAIDNTIKAIEKKARLDAAQRSADSEINKVFGGPQTPRQSIETDKAESFAQIDADVKEAADLAKEAGKQALAAMANASRVIEAQGELAPAAIKAANERDAAVRAADDASAKAGEIKESAAIEKQKIVAQAAGEFQNLSTEVSKTLVDQGEAALKAMEQAAKAEGEKFPRDSKLAMEKLLLIFNDAIPDSQQLDQISTAMVQFRDSQSGAHQSIADNMNAMITNTNQLKANQQTIAAAIAAQSREITILQGRFEQ